jgi:hypothetical protein
MDRHDKNSDMKTSKRPEQREAFIYARCAHQKQAGGYLKRQLASSGDYVKEHNLRLKSHPNRQGYP